MFNITERTLQEVRFDVIERRAQDNTGEFEIGPVVDYMSLPLANALRRVLLSSLPGAAITSICIDGVWHEFADIAHIREDVPEIVQNLKKVRMRSYADRLVTVYLDVQGERVVRAGDIGVPGTIEIVNPEAYIATLDNEKADLSIEMKVGVGRGFVAFDAQKTTEPPPIGTILIDAIYSPVQHVNYTILPVRKDQGDLDTILLNITTDGTISPDEALREAAEILRQQFAVFAHIERDETELPTHASSDVPIPGHIYSMPLEELGLGVRAYNALKRGGIPVVGRILEMDEHDILKLHLAGPRTVAEIATRVQSCNLLPKKKQEGAPS